MQELTELVQNMVNKTKTDFTMDSFCKPLTPEERNQRNIEKAKRDADMMNADEGDLHLYDGYVCEKCKNKGFIYYANGDRVTRSNCDCWMARNSIRRMKKSGLENVIKKYTFSLYHSDEDWQKKIKETAQEFLADNNAKWFFIGGASGSGKSHICTAICRELLKNKAVHYMLWEDESKELRSCIMDLETYQPHMNRLKEVDVLYIDDFLSGHRERGGVLIQPTGPEVALARELFNHRYINGKITIISSEWYSNEIVDIDEALGGRILEKCGKYCLNLERGSGKNYRLKKWGQML